MASSPSPYFVPPFHSVLKKIALSLSFSFVVPFSVLSLPLCLFRSPSQAFMPSSYLFFSLIYYFSLTSPFFLSLLIPFFFSQLRSFLTSLSLSLSLSLSRPFSLSLSLMSLYISTRYFFMFSFILISINISILIINYSPHHLWLAASCMNS